MGKVNMFMFKAAGVKGLLFLAVVLVSFAGGAQAQAWPARPVRLIVSQAAGGTPDIVARLLAQRLGNALGQPLIVENRPGSANMVGAQAAAHATPDGYTLFFATAAALVTNPYTFKSLPYDPVKDFVPIAVAGKAMFLILAHPSVPAKNIKELVALDQAQPGKLAFATDGPRNFSGMVAAWLNKVAGTHFLTVPYNAMPQGLQDTVAGRTQLVILAIPSAAPFMKRGELRALGVSSAARAPGYEDIAPVAETFPGFDLVGWFAFMAPAGTPREVIQRTNRELDGILRDPEVVQRLRTLGFYTEGAGTPESTGQFIRAELERWGQIVREIGIKPE
jgi:tripartite-type tricarboxylate transporter receptor subunit TctC